MGGQVLEADFTWMCPAGPFNPMANACLAILSLETPPSWEYLSVMGYSAGLALDVYSCATAS